MHFLYASKNAKFAASGVKLNLFCTTPSVTLIRSIPFQKKLLELLMLGDPITADVAESLGLVNKVIDDTDEPELLEKETHKFAEKLMAVSPDTLEIGKKEFYKLWETVSIENSFEKAIDVMIQNRKFESTIEKIKGFVEKKKK